MKLLARAARFYSFGSSSKTNNRRLAGYDPVGDWLYAGSMTVSTKNDTVNMAGERMDTDTTTTGWHDNTTILRIGAIPRLKTGALMFDNGSDGEALNIALRLHLESDGATTVGAYSLIEFKVIDSRDPLKVPYTILTLSGQNGGIVTAHCRNASEVMENTVLAQATT